MRSSPAALLTLFIALIVGFYLLNATLSPLETATLQLSGELGEQRNETLGTCSASGSCTFYVSYTPVKAGWVAYADGTPHTAWVNATVAVTLNNGFVNITATGDSNTTTNAQIVLNYARDVPISDLDQISGLPKVAFLIIILVIVVSFLAAAVKGVR